MTNRFILISKIKNWILKYNIHIWFLMIVLFILFFFRIRNAGTKKEVVYPKYIAVTGDSYAGYLIDFENLKDYGMVGYAIAGKSLEENYELIRKAMHQRFDIVVVSIGVNDVVKGTNPETFARIYRSLLLESYKYNKTIITHNYLNFNLNNKYMCKPSDYDKIIRREISDFDNVYYIDMSDYEKKEYLQNDGIHYNKEFYDIFYDKLKVVIDEKYNEDMKRNGKLKNIDIYMLFMVVFDLLLLGLICKIKKTI